jgi:hypothetical protein
MANPILGRMMETARERLEEVTGLTVRDRDEVAGLQETVRELEPFRDEAEDLAAMTIDYVHGDKPTAASYEHRRVLAHRSRIAFVHDPLAGAEANLLANFAFGRGIPKPQANEERVQEIIDEAWEDPVNERKLTSFEAQRHRSNELLTSANLYMVLFEKNGKTRVGFISSDLCTDVVCHSEDDELPLYYVVRKRKQEWDYNTDMPKAWTPNFEGGQEKVWYYRHWRNPEDADHWGLPESSDPDPPAEKIPAGVVEHFRINRVGRTQFGIPPWARTLRYFSAMNQLSTARVSMAQAAASIIAKRVRRGGPSDILKGASNVIQMAGEMATSRFRRGGRDDTSPLGPGTNPPAGKGMAPPPAGAFWLENESDRLEAVRLSSGSAEALQDAQIIRAMPAAASGFGQHYLGDASSTNLSSATTLELPTLMTVMSWQETHEGMYRYFTDRVIENAVKAGRLGGLISESEEEDGRPMGDLIYEEDRQEMEKRTGLDLSYSFELPYPGRRNLTDVVTAVENVAKAFDPAGTNVPLRRSLLDFFFRHGLQVADPAAEVDEILPEDAEPVPFQSAGGPSFDAEGNPVDPQPPPDPQETASQYGEKRKSLPAGKEMGKNPGAKAMQQALEEALRDPELARATMADVDREFALLLDDPAAFLGGCAPSRVNGDGPVPAAR